jgi:hypothetical protein
MMKPLEAISHSFVFRVWREEPTANAGSAAWHGDITHVPDGRRYLCDNLDGIREFIAAYLAELGVSSRRGVRLPRWLRRWRP